jgi:hypothetical protein
MYVYARGTEYIWELGTSILDANALKELDLTKYTYSIIQCAYVRMYLYSEKGNCTSTMPRRCVVNIGTYIPDFPK